MEVGHLLLLKECFKMLLASLLPAVLLAVAAYDQMTTCHAAGQLTCVQVQPSDHLHKHKQQTQHQWPIEESMHGSGMRMKEHAPH